MKNGDAVNGTTGLPLTSVDQGEPPTLEANNDVGDISAFRGRVADLEAALADLLEQNHKLRINSSDAEDGLGRALKLIQTLQQEKMARRHHLRKVGMTLADNTRQLWCFEIPHVDADVNPAKFFRDFIAPNRPCILKADENCRYERIQSMENIEKKCGQHEVSVNITPNGLADAVVNGVFVKPLEKRMTFSEFLVTMRAKRDKEVVYISAQDDSLRKEFPDMYIPPPMGIRAGHDDNPGGWPALEATLDAVNFWVGDERSYSSFHKDHYENFYTVLTGTKVFWLCPPVSAWCMHERLYCTATCMGGPGNWKLESDPESAIPWIPVDAREWEKGDKEYRNQFPDFEHANMQRVELREGESLYLPSLWYHAATQKDEMAAINYWFEMQFDCKWIYYQHLREIHNLA